jgi:hypothetical protein
MCFVAEYKAPIVPMAFMMPKGAGVKIILLSTNNIIRKRESNRPR